MLNIGDKAPDFTLYDADRKLRKMSEFLAAGRRTVLAFFPGAFTGGCTQEFCTLRDMYPELEKLNGTVVGISVDAPFSLKAFSEKNNLSMTLLSDFARDVIRRYDVVWKGLSGIEGYESANRAVFVVDGEGRVLFRWIAESPGKLPDFEAIKKALA